MPVACAYIQNLLKRICTIHIHIRPVLPFLIMFSVVGRDDIEFSVSVSEEKTGLVYDVRGCDMLCVASGALFISHHCHAAHSMFSHFL